MKIFRLFLLFYLLSYSSLTSQIPLQTAESYGDQLVIGIVGEPPLYLHPFQLNNVVEKQLIRFVFGNGLQQNVDRFGQTSNLVSRRIASTLSSKQGKEWIYDLNRNIYFHDGSYLLNDDVRFTFEILKKYGGFILNRKIDFSNIERIDLIGDLGFNIVLKQKDNFFDLSLSDIPILSQDYYQNLSQRGYDLFSKSRPLGNGPFTLEQLSDDNIVLASHSNYVFGRPFLNKVVFRFYENEQLMNDDFLQGKLDFIEVKETITANRLYQVLKDQIKIFSTPRPEKKLFYILFNTNRRPFDNPKVRLAIRSGIDSKEIVDNIVKENIGHVAYSIVDIVHPLFYRDLFQQNYEPGISVNILQEEGWGITTPRGILEKDGEPLHLELLFEENSFLEESIARIVKIQLSELGINVLPKPVSFKEKKRLVELNQYVAVLQDYSYYEDDLFGVVKKFYEEILKNQSAVTNYSNPTIEAIFRRADNNPDLIKQYIRRFQIIINNEAPAIFLYFDDHIFYALYNRFEQARIRQSGDSRSFWRLMPYENWFVPKSLQKYP
ncbi:MAG: ABC transporter substrate-binding protein [bacterium]|nr:MAG: ABC transporter substrate-binding protein [bacterium]